MNARRILIIGIGNAYRRDDAVGLVMARALRECTSGDVQVIEANGDGTALMESWKEAEIVILIDAVQSGAPPGTIHRLDAHAQPIPASFLHSSTHSFGVAEAIELGRALNQLPSKLIVYGIEGADFDAGEGLTSTVAQTVKKVNKAVLAELQVQSKR